MCIKCYRLLKLPVPPPSKIEVSTFFGHYETEESKKARAEWVQESLIREAYNQGVRDNCPDSY